MIETQFKAPKKMIEEFLKDSVIWHDLKLVIDDWVEAAKLEMEKTEPYPIFNYKEVVLNEEDTLDVKIAYASYETTKKE